jgi:hypothetical protein
MLIAPLPPHGSVEMYSRLKDENEKKYVHQQKDFAEVRIEPSVPELHHALPDPQEDNPKRGHERATFVDSFGASERVPA